MGENLDSIKNTFYTASAGSGKTFKLCSRYIALLFSGANASEILTITFTNKAANEMKSRITRNLHALYWRFFVYEDSIESANAKLDTSSLSQHNECVSNSNSYDKEIQNMLQNVADIMDELKEEYNITESIIKSKINSIYFNFLRSEKKISTIDSFFNSILRKFAFFIGIKKDFEIDSNAKNDKNFADFITMAYFNDNLRFILQFLIGNLDVKLKDNTGFNKGFNLKDTIKILYDKSIEFREFSEFNPDFISEKIYADSMEINNFNIDVKNLDSIQNKILELGNELRNVATEILQVSTNGNVKRAFNSLYSCEDAKSFLDNGVVKSKSLHGWLNSLDETQKAKIDSICTPLQTLGIIYENFLESLRLRNIISLINKYKSSIENNQKVTNSITFDGITHKVFDIITDKLSVNESEFNAPYFYYRLDSNIKHILFDEYQDTSIIQYRIFKPLFDEILSKKSEKSLFFVGDSKQSLYGFRGANRDVFENSKNDLEIKSLAYNYRSGKNIVEFVNTKFESIFKESYDIQECKSKIDGFVDIDILDSNNVSDCKELCYEAALRKLQILQENNVKASDIVILARYNSTLEGFIEYAKNNNFKGEFNLENSDNLAEQKVTKIITCVFRFNKYQQKIVELQEINLDFILQNKMKFNEFIKEINVEKSIEFRALNNLDSNNLEWLNKLDLNNFDINNLDSNELIELKEIIIETIESSIKYLKNLQKLQQKTLNKLLGNAYKNDEKIDFHSFLKSKELSLAKKIKHIIESLRLYHSDYVEDSMNLLEIASQNLHISDFEEMLEILQNSPSSRAKAKAITAMSVHKSKGLEYEFVIFINLETGDKDDKKLLYEYNGIYLENIRLGRKIFLSKKLEDLKLIAKQNSIKEENNVRYVACTRPKSGLFIIDGKISDNEVSNTLNLSKDDCKGDILETLKQYNIKETKNIKDSNIKPIIISNIEIYSGVQSEFIETENKLEFLQDMAMKLKQIQGLAMHLFVELLLGFNSKDSVNIVESKYGFYLSKEKILHYYNIVKNFLQNDFKLHFNLKESVIKCELSFLQGKNVRDINIRRLDSVIYSGNKFYILEFKSTQNITTELSKEHENQLKNYINFAKKVFCSSDYDSGHKSSNISSENITGYLIYLQSRNVQNDLSGKKDQIIIKNITKD